MNRNDGSKYLNIVMFEPEIPQNTGNVARLCACCNAKLYLIGRLGFSLNDKYLKRSGLDYWDKVEIEHIIDFEEFENMFTDKNGLETRGSPEEILTKYNKNCVTIPMNENTRSLNLSNSIAIGAYEAIRQFGGIKA